MQQHGALGNAGGAAGILQEGDVVGPDRRRGERQGAARAQHIVEREGLRQAIGRHHFLDVAHDAVDHRAFHEAEHVAHAGDDDVLDLRVRQRLLQHGGEILQHHDRLGAGVVELEFQFARLVERVDVHHHAAGAQRAGDRHRILQHVRHHQRDARAGFHAAALQPGGEGARGLVEPAIGQRRAHADAGRAAGIKPEAFLEHRHQRGVARGVDLGGNARWIVRKPKPFHDGARFPESDSPPA